MAGALSSAELAAALKELSDELQRAREAIAGDVLQSAAGAVQGGLMGMIRASVQVPLSSLGRAFQAQATELRGRAELAAKQGLTALSDRLKGAAEQLSGLSQAAGLVGTAFTALLGLPGDLLSMIRGPVALASPSAESTLQGNLNLLSATVGKDLIPSMYRLSAVIYGIGRLWDSGPGRYVGGLAAAPGMAAMAALNAAGVNANDTPRDMVTDPARMFSSAKDIHDSLTLASLNASGQQTAQRLAQLQLQMLTESNQLLKEIRDRQPTGAKLGNWRG